MVTKAQAAAVAYNAIYGNMGEFVSYEDKMKRETYYIKM